MDRAPNRRQSLEGVTFDGASLRLVYTIARKLYRCPGCSQAIEIGSAHTLVQYLSSQPRRHQHWHRECAARQVTRELKTRRVVQAN